MITRFVNHERRAQKALAPDETPTWTRHARPYWETFGDPHNEPSNYASPPYTPQFLQAAADRWDR
jgi:hypothetical protein